MFQPSFSIHIRNWRSHLHYVFLIYINYGIYVNTFMISWQWAPKRTLTTQHIIFILMLSWKPFWQIVLFLHWYYHANKNKEFFEIIIVFLLQINDNGTCEMMTRAIFCKKIFWINGNWSKRDFKLMDFPEFTTNYESQLEFRFIVPEVFLADWLVKEAYCVTL